MKRHGMWQWHKSLNERWHDICWWKNEDEMQRARSRVSAMHIFTRSDYGTVQAMVIRCANRYFRRAGIRPNIAQWNALTNVICDRMQARANTRNAVVICIGGIKQHTKLQEPHAEWELPYPAYLRMDIDARLERILEKWLLPRAIVSAAYEDAETSWLELPSESEWSRTENHCPVCGAYFGYIVWHNYRTPGDQKRHTSTRRFNTYAPAQSRIEVCKKVQCRAIAAYSHYIKTPKKGNQLLIGVINECTKRKGNNPLFRGLAKHFARHA